MLNWFRRRAEEARTAGELYGGVVAAARQPMFYEALGVPDTPEGRFELVALHLFLALDGLRTQEGGAGQGLAQRTIEAFVSDMDDCLREMGVGDLTVPKKVKRAAAAFYERTGAYRSALSSEAGEGELGAALLHRVYGGDAARAGQAEDLARHVRATWRQKVEAAGRGAARLGEHALGAGAP